MDIVTTLYAMQYRIQIWAWIGDYVHNIIWDVIIYPCPDFNGGLTHWSRVTHICVVKLTIIGSDNGLSPERRQAIIWTNAGILLIGPLGTNFIETLIGIQTLSFKKMDLKMSSAKRRPFCLGLNGLIKPPLTLGYEWVITPHCLSGCIYFILALIKLLA